MTPSLALSLSLPLAEMRTEQPQRYSLVAMQWKIPTSVNQRVLLMMAELRWGY